MDGNANRTGEMQWFPTSPPMRYCRIIRIASAGCQQIRSCPQYPHCISNKWRTCSGSPSGPQLPKTIEEFIMLGSSSELKASKTPQPGGSLQFIKTMFRAKAKQIQSCSSRCRACCTILYLIVPVWIGPIQGYANLASADWDMNALTSVRKCQRWTSCRDIHMDPKNRAWARLQNHIQIVQKHSDLRHEEHEVGQKGLQQLLRPWAVALQLSSCVSTTLSAWLHAFFYLIYRSTAVHEYTSNNTYTPYTTFSLQIKCCCYWLSSDCRAS